MINRRNLLLSGAAGLVAASLPLGAQDHSAHTIPQPTKSKATESNTSEKKLTTNEKKATAAVTKTAQGYTPVITPNGRTLAYRMNNGVKEFHLIGVPGRFRQILHKLLETLASQGFQHKTLPIFGA